MLLCSSPRICVRASRICSFSRVHMKFTNRQFISEPPKPPIGEKGDTTDPKSSLDQKEVPTPFLGDTKSPTESNETPQKIKKEKKAKVNVVKGVLPPNESLEQVEQVEGSKVTDSVVSDKEKVEKSGKVPTKRRKKRTKLFSINSVPNPYNNALAVSTSDYASIIDKETLPHLDNECYVLKEEYDCEVVFATLPCLPKGYSDGQSAAKELFHLWQMGNKDVNHAILLVSIVQEKSVEICTSPDLHHKLDIKALYKMPYHTMLPHFSKSEYGEGFQAATQEIQKLIANQSDKVVTGSTFTYRPFLLATTIILSIVGGLFYASNKEHKRSQISEQDSCEECGEQFVSIPLEISDRNDQMMQEERMGNGVYCKLRCQCEETIVVRKPANSNPRCSKCKGFTNHTIRTTISESTRERKGRQKVENMCGYCQHYSAKIHATPRLLDDREPKSRNKKE